MKEESDKEEITGIYEYYGVQASPWIGFVSNPRKRPHPVSLKFPNKLWFFFYVYFVSENSRYESYIKNI